MLIHKHQTDCHLTFPRLDHTIFHYKSLSICLLRVDPFSWFPFFKRWRKFHPRGNKNLTKFSFKFFSFPILENENLLLIECRYILPRGFLYLLNSFSLQQHWSAGKLGFPTQMSNCGKKRILAIVLKNSSKERKFKSTHGRLDDWISILYPQIRQLNFFDTF